jgi:hypothetical protein
MAAPEFSVSLTIDLSDGTTRTQEFTSDEPIMVGSGGSAHVRIEDENVSSLHCMLKPVDDRIVVLDLGSDEGTEVNGKEITGETEIADGDVVQIGGAKIAIHFGGDMLAPTVPLRRGADPEVTAKEPAPESEVEKTVRQRAPKDDDTAVESAAEAENPPVKAEAATTKASGKKAKGKKADATDALPARKTASAASADKTEIVDRKRGSSAAAISAIAQPGDLTPDLGDEEKPADKSHVDVTMMWGGSVMGVSRINGQGSVTIGDGKDTSFHISHAAIPALAFTLVSLTKDGATVHVAKGMELLVDGQARSENQLRLEMNQRVVVRVGAVEFVIQFSKRYRAIDLGLFQTLDYLYSKVFALAMILQLGLIAAFLLTPTLHDEDEDDLLANLNEFQALILTPPEKKQEKKQDLSGKKAAKAKDDEGLFGKKDKPKEDKAASKKGAPTVDKDKREEDRKIAMDALAALGLKGPDGAVSNVLGPGGLGAGVNNALGGLRGAAMGDAGGAGGLGSRGTGAGGGGDGLGIGGIGSGTGRGSGGSGGVNLGGRGKGMTRIQPGKITYKGSLSREEIQRVIRRVMSQIRFCYERELNKDPNLNGKIVLQWTIAGTGLVKTASVAQSTMGSPAVEGCVTRIVQRLRFPQPKGGGEVFVTYPFVFSPSG